jgi:hypothetical protein
MTEAPAPSVGDGPAIGAGQLGGAPRHGPGLAMHGVHLTGARLAEATLTHGLSVRLGEERNRPPLRHGPPAAPPAVAAGRTVGDNESVNRDSPLPSHELLNWLRRIAEHDDAPDTVQADVRDYLRHLEAASSGSGSLTSEGRLTMAAGAAQHGREVVQRVPRPRCGSRL